MGSHENSRPGKSTIAAGWERVWNDRGPALLAALFLIIASAVAPLAPAAAARPGTSSDVTQLSAEFRAPHRDRPIDTDGDGQFDLLIVEVNLTVNRLSRYTVEGVLHDPLWAFAVYDSITAVLRIGNRTVSLFYDGPLLNSSGIDGPYTVDLDLRDAADDAFNATDLHRTRAYSHLEFETPSATITAPHADSGIDTDGDGLYNFLIIDVTVTVAVRGMYYLAGRLSDRAGTSYPVAYVFAELEAGAAIVRLGFTGARLKLAGIDGPYTIDLALANSDTGVGQDLDLHTTQAYAHGMFDELVQLASSMARTPPRIDGRLAPGEWSNATVENLADEPGNDLPGFLLVMHDDRFLYVAYDVIGDTSPDPYDIAAIAFDTGNDGLASGGHEDEFAEGGAFEHTSYHIVYDNRSGFWAVEDWPYDNSLPDHDGLASVRAFSSSERSADPHRSYEFSIPLALIRARPGDTIGFFAGSHSPPGILDGFTFRYSAWPANEGGPLPLELYADLFLTPDLASPAVRFLSPQSGDVYRGGDVLVAWDATDEGFGLDRIELALDGGPPATLSVDDRSHLLQSLPDGTHVVRVAAFDRGGNTASATVTFVVDTTKPTMSITSPAYGAIVPSSTLEISWRAADAASGVARIEVSLDGGPSVVLAGDATAFTFAQLADGPHVVTLTAYDLAGHSVRIRTTFTVDTAILSPTGPYGFGPMAGVIAAAALAIASIFLLHRRRRQKSPPPEGR